MAEVVPAHVTLVYPEEVVDEQLLLQRAEWAFRAVAPFQLRLGEVVADEGGLGGVFVAVDDVDGAWSLLRRELLIAPMIPMAVSAHATIAHPRTSALGEACWAELAGRRLDVGFVVQDVLFTQTTDAAFTVLRRFTLCS